MLHPDDERTLEFSFADDDHAEDRSRKLAEALGIDLNAVRGLSGTIQSDLRGVELLPPGSEPLELLPGSFGIAWWTAYAELGDSRRLLIGDYLIEVVEAIETNLIEARLHLSAFRGALQANPRHKIATPRSFVDSYLAQLHVSGMLRAAVSTVDCICAATVGVLGLPLRIKKAAFGDVNKWLSEKAPKLPTSAGLTFQCETVRDVLALFTKTEPPGWFDWATDYRNTFVHRGRRHQTWHPDVGVRVPAEPDRSELESLLASPYPEALHEPAEVTLAGVWRNVHAASLAACMLLNTAWRERRADPLLIVQPRVQWPADPPLDAGASFHGFAREELANTNVVKTSPSNYRRLAASAVDLRLKHLWKRFT